MFPAPLPLTAFRDDLQLPLKKEKNKLCEGWLISKLLAFEMNCLSLDLCCFYQLSFIHRDWL